METLGLHQCLYLLVFINVVFETQMDVKTEHPWNLKSHQHLWQLYICIYANLGRTPKALPTRNSMKTDGTMYATRIDFKALNAFEVLVIPT